MMKLRILQINKYYYPHIGGIERVVQQIAEGLSENTETTVLVSAEDRRRHVEREKGITLIRLARQFKLGSMPVSLGIFREVRKLSGEQDIIQLHMPYPLGDLALLLSGFRGKVVLWWHSDVVRQKKLMLLYKPVMLRMLKRADAIIVATQGHIDGSAYLKPFAEKCRIIPYGVEPAIEAEADRYILEQSVVRKEPVEPETDAAERNLHILFAGRFAAYKGCDILLKAFARVKGAELYLTGSGRMEAALRKEAVELAVLDRIHFLGELSEQELCEQYKKCDVLVLPSVGRNEAFGLVQIEAMCFGKPVINTRVRSGVPCVSIHQETGLTVEPGDVDELAEAMQWMAEHREESRLMGERARRRVKEEYGMGRMLDQLLDLYRELSGSAG